MGSQPNIEPYRKLKVMTKIERYERAIYRFYRHIQDQIEDVPGWMQSDFYHPEIDAYEFNKFVSTLGKQSNALRWHELHEKYADHNDQK